VGFDHISNRGDYVKSFLSSKNHHHHILMIGKAMIATVGATVFTVL